MFIASKVSEQIFIAKFIVSQRAVICRLALTFLHITFIPTREKQTHYALLVLILIETSSREVRIAFHTTGVGTLTRSYAETPPSGKCISLGTS